MANTNIPGAPRLVRTNRGTLQLRWETPVSRGHGWNVYAAIEGATVPLAGPPLNSLVLNSQAYLLTLTDVAGNDPPGNDILVAVTSVELNTGVESAQGPARYLNVETMDLGDPDRVAAGRTPSGAPVYLATDEDGRLLVSPDSGIALEPCTLGGQQNNNFTVTTTATDFLDSGRSPAPLSSLKMVILQNRGTEVVYLGDATTQDHVLPANGIRVITADEILVGVWARVSTGTGTLNIWEFN